MKPEVKLGLVIAAAIAVADWLSKYIVLYVIDLPARQNIQILPFFDLTMVWNRGVSFGMLQADSPYAHLALTGFVVLISLGVVAWLWQNTDKLSAIALGGILGGALGNIYDRVKYGAVADFFDFHLMGYHWYVFNLADAAISIGVTLLLIRTFWVADEVNEADK
ncbi:MAG TPA: signal peptidase II [Alphaproteobacteria bacterium]|nr:signal peptidase II [Alphaproteobacteria bacterium]